MRDVPSRPSMAAYVTGYGGHRRTDRRRKTSMSTISPRAPRGAADMFLTDELLAVRDRLFRQRCIRRLLCRQAPLLVAGRAAILGEAGAVPRGYRDTIAPEDTRSSPRPRRLERQSPCHP